MESACIRPHFDAVNLASQASPPSAGARAEKARGTGISARHPAREQPAATAGADRADPGQRSGIGSATLLMAGVVLGWLTILLLVLRFAALPPAASGKHLVLFAPGTPWAGAFGAIVAAGGAPVRPVLGGLGWIAEADAPGFVARLETNGALAAYPGAPVGLALAGCFASPPTSITRSPPPSTRGLRWVP